MALDILDPTLFSESCFCIVNKDVLLAYVAQFNALFYKIQSQAFIVIWWADKSYHQFIDIRLVFRGLAAVVPSTGLIDVLIPGHHKVEVDVSESCPFDVEALKQSNLEDTGSLGDTNISVGGHKSDVFYRTLQRSQRLGWGLGEPIWSGYKLQGFITEKTH